MERLGFTLPDFTRLAWVNDRARETWEPRVLRIGRAWAEMEWRSVVDGVRPCCIHVTPYPEVIERSARWIREGLCFAPLEFQGLSNYSYASTGVAPRHGEAIGERVVLGRREAVHEFLDAWEARDEDGIGRMLGYPECCRAFFERTWAKGASVDPTWEAALAGAEGADDLRLIEVSGRPESNILWRWAGVRAVPHLPCSFDCEATVEFGRAILAVGRRNGFAEEVAWIEEILSWPAEWSCLHGIAEIKTPVLRVSTRTDSTRGCRRVQRQGTRYPHATAARGLRFPFQTRAQAPGAVAQFERGLENPIADGSARPEWLWTDNGFPSEWAMHEEHRSVARYVAKAVRGHTEPRILDLGCGNGALLRKIQQFLPGARVFGVDSDVSRVAHAHELSRESGGEYWSGDLLTVDAPWADGARYDVVLLMPGRLLEAGRTASRALMKRLESQCDMLVIYAYGDWRRRFGSVAELVRRSGLHLAEVDERDGVGVASAARRTAALSEEPAREGIETR